jgi:hypothetical protein
MIGNIRKRYADETLAIESTLRYVLKLSRHDDVQDMNLIFLKYRPNSLRPPHPSGVDLPSRTFFFQPEESVPLFREMECFVRNPEFPVCSELIFGITLLVESSKAFVWTGEIPNPINCRLQALRLAGELRKGIEVVCEMEKDESMAAAHHDSDYPALILNMSTCTTSRRG